MKLNFRKELSKLIDRKEFLCILIFIVNNIFNKINSLGYPDLSLPIRLHNL